MRPLLGLLAGLLTAAAAPPPPAPPAPEFDRTIDGYEIAPFYQRWMFWVQASKGSAFRAMLARPQEIEGEQVARYMPILEYSWNDDFGPYLAGDIYAYCRRDDAFEVIAGSCHYRLRQVSNMVNWYQTDGPIMRWARQAFDPDMLASRLRAIGWVAGTPTHDANPDRIFATLPSPIPMLIENSTLALVDSRQCPAMARALAALDRRRVDWRMDMTQVGVDGRADMLAAHAEYAVYKLSVRTRRGEVTLEGGGGALHALVGPVIRAAHACLARPASQ